jgi:hypothetical protein
MGKNQRLKGGLQQAQPSNAFQKRGFATISEVTAGKPQTE